MKNIVVLLICLLSFYHSPGQTNVSGGIFADATWTQANSPYIVTDTVVVFPNVVLTIEPGVMVKFADSVILEIRQGKLVAIGTGTDSISFTSNSSSPFPGIYPGVYLNGGNLTSTFNYCNFKYASSGIKVTVADSVLINNSNFKLNTTGLQFIGNSSSQVAKISNSAFVNNTSQGLDLENLNAAIINYCAFNYNNTGFILGSQNFPTPAFSSTVSHCNFWYNTTGMLCDMENSAMDYCTFSYNTTGFQSDGYQSSFDTYHNSITNSTFNFNQTGLASLGHTLVDNCTISRNQTGISSGGVNRIKNCTLDSNSSIAVHMYNDSVINCGIRYNNTGVVTGSVSVVKDNSIEYSTGANISTASGVNTITGNTITGGNIGIDNSAAATYTITKNAIVDNNTGINLASSNTVLNCNRICNNVTYAIKYTAISNLNATHNYWCTPDSASTETFIYDGHDNINYGLLTLLPFDSACSPNNPTMTVDEMTTEGNGTRIYPNPFSGQTIIQCAKILKNATVAIYNVFGQQLKQINNITGQTIIVQRENLPEGIYFLQILQGNKIVATKKVVIADN